jgi:hypothetical protein
MSALARVCAPASVVGGVPCPARVCVFAKIKRQKSEFVATVMGVQLWGRLAVFQGAPGVGVKATVESRWQYGRGRGEGGALGKVPATGNSSTV